MTGHTVVLAAYAYAYAYAYVPDQVSRTATKIWFALYAVASWSVTR